ncbi:hypothetical protein PHYSODRAFT_249657 [Phytophthora sojae]|uniref:DUF7869 domain-containing protein n=1 Tax=Phytophthora sojae (strain P6497) TaxID=1094619 RepID=G4Z745_PHYSP|nr:hypothetical protein PHYSODRAFT_249657 [Phytophthora sojae]EGZ22429.1 hypothetical protein PHYSODRAFT_249657 [Phytophthora sojae]|eukprot:XP_009525146.1 hypothetical protein PHYSODRAFT_249657 [Phytophthora sojae]
MSSHEPSPTLPASAESSAPETRSTPSPTPAPSAPTNGAALSSPDSCPSQEVEVQLAQNASGAEAVLNDASSGEEESEEPDSEEPDESDDKDWSDNVGSAGEEDVTGESAESEADEEEEDISINLLDVDVQQCVTNLIRDDVRERRCLQGKAGELEWLMCSLGQMSKPEKTICILTLLGVLMQTDTAERRRGNDEREKFHYYLPFVGRVRRPSFARCLGVQPLTIQRYKRRVRDGNIAAKVHGNRLNKNTSKIYLVWLVKWFKEFAAEVGEMVHVRVRMQKTKNGMMEKYYSREDCTLLPATFTWETLYDEMHKFVSLGLRVCEPARSTFRKLLSVHCPNIKIRSAQSNSRMRRGASAKQVEELGQHTESARRMRREYKMDKAAVHASDGSSGDVAVIVMDFSQNLTIPSVTTTPSQWYFCSLLAVNVFGIFYENEGVQTNYVYDEFVSGKGSDQINLMLQHFIRTVLLPAGKKHLIVYADNCSGQNKNNHVIKFFLTQVQMGVFDRIDYKFFVKGHTKNSCDRGFGHIRRHVGRADCWTMDHIFFKSYKPLVTELYKKLVGVQQYQIFRMETAKPGVVQCKKGPDDEPVEQDLRRKVDGVLTESTMVERMLTHFLEDLSPPSLNAEKMTELYSKIRPYVPDEFQDDPIYAAPSQDQQDDAKSAKQARREHRAAMAKAAKQNSDRRGRNEGNTSAATKKRKTNSE